MRHQRPTPAHELSTRKTSERDTSFALARGGFLALALAMLSAVPAPSPASPGEQEGKTGPGVRAELEEICRTLRASDQIYYGERSLRELAGRLGEGAAPIGEPEEEARLWARYGRELLQTGEPLEAVSAFTRALDLAEPAKLPAGHRIRFLQGLGMAHLQAAEDANCVARHNPASCILPLRREGVHTRPEHARRAGDAFRAILDIDPTDVEAGWLFNLARMISGDFPEAVPERFRLPADAFAPESPFPLWLDIAPRLGLDVVDLAGGAVMDDFDGDGLLDIITSTADPCDHPKAFRNDGRGGFEEKTAAWGLDEQFGGGLNMIHGDYDGDGRLDLLVLRGAWLHEHGRIRNSLLRNELSGSGGRFVDVTAAAGLAQPPAPTQTAAWADYDGDGDLDLYVGNEATDDDPHPSQLFRNDGDGTFTDVTAAAGVANDRYAKGVAWGDYDNDGDPDIYVSNIGPNRLYRNDGDGTFTDVAPALGVTRPTKRSFASWFFDFDNDGDLDLFVVDYGTPVYQVAATYFGFELPEGQPLIYRNDGGRFTEISRTLGLTRPSAPMGTNYGDLDNDGWLDFYLGTGDPQFESLVPNVMYRNDGGTRFRDVTFSGGFGHLQKGHGVAFGDLDNDGDQDLFHQLGGFFPGDEYGNVLFENPGNGNRWITLRLAGRKANRFGIGARIEVRVRKGEQVRSIHTLTGSGGSFGGSSFQQEIGLGDAEAIEEVVIRWPGSGTVQRFREVAPDRVYRVIEGKPELAPVVLPHLKLGGRSTPEAARRH